MEKICVKCTGITSEGKKKVFYVIVKNLLEAVEKAENYTFKNTKLKAIKNIINLEVVATTTNNSLIV